MRKTWIGVTTTGWLLSAALGMAACGGNGKVAEGLMPDLSDQGLILMQEGRDPYLPEDSDTYRTIYADSQDATRGVLTAVYVEDDEARAIETFHVLKAALKNPPPVFFGGEAVQLESESLGIGDESAAWVTEQPDRNGRVIWTDLHRSGRTVLLTQVLESYDADHSDFRRLVAERVFAKAPK